MTSNLNFRHRPPSDVGSYILTESQSPVSVVLDDTVQGVHHQFTRVSVSPVDCNRTDNDVSVSFRLTEVNDRMTVDTGLDSGRSRV